VDKKEFVTNGEINSRTLYLYIPPPLPPPLPSLGGGGGVRKGVKLLVIKLIQ
jgi:hypothetical protein